MRPELSFYLVLTSPMPFTTGPTVHRVAQRLFVRHFLANVLLLRNHVGKSGVGSVQARRAFLADHSFITTRAPYKNKTTRNQYLIRRFGYRVTVVINPGVIDSSWDDLNLEKLAELRDLVGSLDFAHGSMAFAATSLKARFSPALPKAFLKNGRPALSIC